MQRQELKANNYDITTMVYKRYARPSIRVRFYVPKCTALDSNMYVSVRDCGIAAGYGDNSLITILNEGVNRDKVFHIYTDGGRALNIIQVDAMIKQLSGTIKESGADFRVWLMDTALVLRTGDTSSLSTNGTRKVTKKSKASETNVDSVVQALTSCVDELNSLAKYRSKYEDLVNTVNGALSGIESAIKSMRSALKKL